MRNLLIFLSLMIFVPGFKLHAHEIQFFVGDTGKPAEITVILLKKNDTISVYKTNSRFFTLKNINSRTVLTIIYKNQRYQLNRLKRRIKSIIIYYKYNTGSECYIVTEYNNNGRIKDKHVASDHASSCQTFSEILLIHMKLLRRKDISPLCGGIGIRNRKEQNMKETNEKE